MTRVLRLLLTLLLAAPAAVLAVGPGAPPANACDCATGPGVAGYLEDAEAVVVVRVTGPAGPSDDTLRIEAPAEVTHVYTGDVPDRIAVTTISQDSACGQPRLLREGRSLLLIGDLVDGRMGVYLCGPASGPTERNLAEVERVLGPGEARPIATSVPSPEPNAPSAGAPEAEDASGLLWVAAACGAVALAVGVVLRRRRTRA